MRKPMLSVVVLTLVVCVLSGCSIREKESMTNLLNNQELADKFVSEVVYVKDPATKLCDAYYWGGTSDGGPAMTLVPEDAIPPGRLLVGRPTR